MKVQCMHVCIMCACNLKFRFFPFTIVFCCFVRLPFGLKWRDKINNRGDDQVEEGEHRHVGPVPGHWNHRGHQRDVARTRARAGGIGAFSYCSSAEQDVFRSLHI